nr:nitronate monooxygenase [Streptomyces sp. HB202]
MYGPPDAAPWWWRRASRRAAISWARCTGTPWSPRCARSCRRPCIVAAGGIGSPDKAARALSAGADGVLLGTAFVVAHESQAHSYFKKAVSTADETDTVISDVYEIGWPGRRHRVLETSATRDAKQPRKFIGRTVVEGKPYLIPRFSAAAPTEATSGRIEEMAMYCGLSCGAISGGRPAAEIVADFARILRGVEIFETGTG